MDSPRPNFHSPFLSPSSSGRKSTDSTSPEFEFWITRNPSFPQADLLSADELFSDGVLLPLQLLHHHHNTDPPPDLKDPDPTTTETELLSTTVETVGTLTGSKRWKNIFKKGEKKSTVDKEKKIEKKSQTRASSAELNINIWPFSRSRSAGNNGSRRIVTGAGLPRKVSSAPCSRSNSAGESKSRKWPSSPARAGVHLGRTSPVWQVKPVVRNSEKGVIKKESATETRRSKEIGGGVGGRMKGRGLNLNVPMCIGYRQHLSCRSEKNGVGSGCGGGGGGGGSRGGGNVGSGGGNLFNLRGLLNKKVY